MIADIGPDTFVNAVTMVALSTAVPALVTLLRRLATRANVVRDSSRTVSVTVNNGTETLQIDLPKDLNDRQIAVIIEKALKGRDSGDAAPEEV